MPIDGDYHPLMLSWKLSEPVTHIATRTLHLLDVCFSVRLNPDWSLLILFHACFPHADRHTHT